jgi:hypothetical protein
VVQQLQLMNVAYVLVMTALVMKVVVQINLVLQVVITPVVQQLLMMNVAYAMAITHPVLTVLAYQMVILL